jgi:hypothetical protein
MPRRVFTSAAIEKLRSLANEGKTAVEIAHAIGSTPGSVRVLCSRLKIRLSRQGRLPSLAPSLRERRIIIYMSSDDYVLLERQAARRQKSVAEYAGMLLQTIVRANIYDAVLDEDD